MMKLEIGKSYRVKATDWGRLRTIHLYKEITGIHHCAEVPPGETFLVIEKTWYQDYECYMYKLLCSQGLGWFACACAQGFLALRDSELEEITVEMEEELNDDDR